MLSESFVREACFSNRRREPAEYVHVFLSNGISEFGWEKWYHDAVGEEFLCQIRRDYSTGQIKELYPVRLTKTKIEIGRAFDPKDCIIL